MKATKLFNFIDKQIDRQAEEFVRAINSVITPEYANNAAALAGGLKVGDQYHTAAGVRMEVV